MSSTQSSISSPRRLFIDKRTFHTTSFLFPAIPLHKTTLLKAILHRTAFPQTSMMVPFPPPSRLTDNDKRVPLYLSADGQGPMACEDVDGVSGEAGVAWISRPQLGKHICFDGRYLHAAPADLALPLAEDRRQTLPSAAIAATGGHGPG